MSEEEGPSYLKILLIMVIIGVPAIGIAALAGSYHPTANHSAVQPNGGSSTTPPPIVSGNVCRYNSVNVTYPREVFCP